MNSWSPPPIERRELPDAEKAAILALRQELAAELAAYALTEHGQLAEYLGTAHFMFEYVSSELCDVISEHARHAYDDQLEEFNSRALKSEEAERLAIRQYRFYIKNITVGGCKEMEKFILTR